MNRREALKAVVAAIGVGGVSPVTVKTFTPTLTTHSPAPVLAVLEYPGRMSHQVRHNLLKTWEASSPFPDCKLVVLEEGVRLRFYDASGREMALEVEQA